MKKLRKIINKNKSTTKKTQFQALSTPPLNRYNCKINKIIHNQSICMKKKWKEDKENAKNGNFRTYTDQWREERSRHGSKRDQKRGFKGIGIGFLRRDVAGDSCKLHGWSDDDLCSPIGYSSTTEGEWGPYDDHRRVKMISRLELPHSKSSLLASHADEVGPTSLVYYPNILVWVLLHIIRFFVLTFVVY